MIFNKYLNIKFIIYIYIYIYNTPLRSNQQIYNVDSLVMS